MSGVIKEIIKTDGKYAVIGLPCFLKGLRLASSQNKNLKEKILIVLGLVCGQMKSKNYTTYLAKMAGIDGELSKVNYRGKDKDKPASNFYFIQNFLFARNEPLLKSFFNKTLNNFYLIRAGRENLKTVVTCSA